MDNKINTIELTQENAKNFIERFPRVIIVDFYADWCQPCKIIEPIFEEISLELKDKYSFAKINIDKCADFAKECEILSIPTIAIFSNGKLIEKINGLQTKDSLLKRIEQAFVPTDLSQLTQQELNEKFLQGVQSMSSLEYLQKLVDAGANINAVSPEGFSPLMQAIILTFSGIDNSKVINFLLENGVSTELDFPNYNQKMDAYNYILSFAQNQKNVISNCEKILDIFNARKQIGNSEKHCSNGSCTI